MKMTVAGIFCTLALTFAGCSEVSEEDLAATSVELACKDWVKDRLKSPASADFQRPDVIGGKLGRWKVEGVVDADNSFGASLRMSYTCVADLEGETITLVSLDVDDS